MMHDRRQFDALLTKDQLAKADAPGVEQVIDQPHHLSDLPVHNIHRRINRIGGAGLDWPDH